MKWPASAVNGMGCQLSGGLANGIVATVRFGAFTIS